MTIELNSCVVRPEEIMSASVDKDIVILNMASNSYVSLDAIGRRIWDLVETPTIVNDLCLQLSREFDAGEDQVSADVLSFLNELFKEGLVRVVS